MRRVEIPGAWYSFATTQGGWGALIPGSHIESSEGQIPLPRFSNQPDNVLYLVGATYNNRLVMAGQSHAGAGCWLYWQGIWVIVGNTFGVSPCAFSGDGRFLYVADSATTGYYRDMHTLDHTPFVTTFYADGIRGIVPPLNIMVLGNTTQSDPARRISEFLDFGSLTTGQGASGLLTISAHGRRISEPGGTFFIRSQFDGTNIALATVKQTENKAVLHWLTYDELSQFPLEGAAPADPIVVINKPLWLGWAEFTGFVVPPFPPGNCSWRTSTGLIRTITPGHQLAQWVQGNTVESIEQQAAASTYPAVAYWDARYWPRYPVLPANSWLALQAYRRSGETPAQFEADMRMVIAMSRDAGYRHIALVCQCYTSNLSLTADLAGNVPVYARLARDFPQVTMLLVFSDQGRATGLQDHPELRAPWQQLANGITGTPVEAPTMNPPVVTVSAWTLDELLNGREFRVRDTANPTEGYEFRVHVRNGSMYAEIKNTQGTASTGLVRPVKVCPPVDPNPGPGPDPNPEPGPDPIPGPGPIGAATIQVNGQYFRRATGEPMTVIESSDFSLFKRYLDHDAATVDPVIAQRQALRFNTLRVWLLNRSVVAFRNGVEQDMIHPNQYIDFYSRLTQFVDFLADKGLCVELTVFTSTGGLMPNANDQQVHLERTAQAVHGRQNVILELVNEDNQWDNAVDPGLIRPSGVIISHGSNGSDWPPKRPTWDYELYHIIGGEFQRKVGHNAMEWADQSGAPCICNETQRYPDNDSSTVHAYDAAMGGALLCAGSCFHSQGGKFSRVFDPTEEACASAWVAGAESVPLEFQTGAYARHDDLNGPDCIRAYSRTLGDGRRHLIKIRP